MASLGKFIFMFLCRPGLSVLRSGSTYSAVPSFSFLNSLVTNIGMFVKTEHEFFIIKSWKAKIEAGTHLAPGSIYNRGLDTLSLLTHIVFNQHTVRQTHKNECNLNQSFYNYCFLFLHMVCKSR